MYRLTLKRYFSEKALLNKHTFNSLPQPHQYRLTQLLPPVDRHVASDNSVRLSPSALSNEFFAFACQEWWERLSEGEFTHENQLKRKWDEERERSKLDPWKIKYFEPIWGQKYNFFFFIFMHMFSPSLIKIIISGLYLNYRTRQRVIVYRVSPNQARLLAK